jgi:hypothetical protein
MLVGRRDGSEVGSKDGLRKRNKEAKGRRKKMNLVVTHYGYY